MKKLLLAALIALVPVFAFAAGEITVAWDPNPVEENVEGYRVYWSQTSGTYTQADRVEVLSPTVQATTPTLADGTWYLVATAYRGTAESGYSVELTAIIDANGNVSVSPPGNARIIDITHHF